MTAAARKMPTEAQPAPGQMSTHQMFAEGLKRVNVADLMEAEREYGDDFERELADLEAGNPPSRLRAR